VRRLRRVAAIGVACAAAGCAGILGLGSPREERDDATVDGGAADAAAEAREATGPDALDAPSEATTEAAAEAGISCPMNWVSNDGSACVLDFSTGWTVSIDSNVDGVVNFTETSTPTSITATYTGDNPNLCGCSAEHLVIYLGRTFDCATTTLQFDYTTSIASADDTNSPSLYIWFCSGGGCPAADLYWGPGFRGSEYTGHSNCALGTLDYTYWPAVPAIHQGTNTVSIATLDGGEDGLCPPGGTFDTVDVHVQGYACYPSETATSTLSNVTFF
jgi:hypothetical protein